MITSRFSRRSTHSLTMLWENCVMRNAYCHNGHPFNHNQSAGVDLPNDFDNSSGQIGGLCCCKICYKKRKTHWNIKDYPCPSSQTPDTKPSLKPSSQVSHAIKTTRKLKPTVTLGTRSPTATAPEHAPPAC